MRTLPALSLIAYYASARDSVSLKHYKQLRFLRTL